MSNKVAFQRLVDLIIALIMLHYTRSCNCRVAPTKVYLREHSYSGAVGKYLPGHCDSVPITRLLVYSTYRMTLFVHIQVSSVFVTYKRVVGS